MVEPAQPETLLRQWAEWDAGRRALKKRRGGFGPAICRRFEALLLAASSNGWLDGTSYPKAHFRKRLDALAEWAKTGV